MKTKSNDIIMQNKIFLWIALATGLILLIPLLSKWPWTLSDFVVMGTLIFGISLMFVLAARKVRKKKHRVAIGVAFAVAFLWLWIELAVGLFTTWGS